MASPVAGATGESGSLTVRVLGCEAGTTAGSVGPTVCSEITDELDIEIAGAGDPRTVDDSLRLSAGVFRWTRLPYDTYRVAFAGLPDGYTAALATADASAAPEEIGGEGFEVTIDGADASPTITVYLIP